jgi:integrase
MRFRLTLWVNLWGNMGHSSNKLSSLTVQRISQPGRYADGHGLYLECSDRGTKSWIFRFMLNGKARAMGLGPFPVIGLADARIKTLECRKLLLEGTDPIEARAIQRREREFDKAKEISFDACAAAYIESHKIGWKNAKHASQWVNTLATYVSPIFGSQPVQIVDTALVMRVLESIWQTKPETASRVRSRLELVLSWATTRGYREGENPARWRGHLDNLLPKRSSVKRVAHFAAMPINSVGNFMSALREQVGVAPRALEFLILCASRTGEVIGARWNEVNIKDGTWIIPSERMKAKREHRVPLAPRAIEILKEMQRKDNPEYVFPSLSGDKPLSNMALLMLLRRMEIGVTAHGFRSTFRDWAAERTNFPREVAEAALAHTLKDKVEAAYRRGDLFEKRRRLMTEWAKFCFHMPAVSQNVIDIQFPAKAMENDDSTITA